MDQIRRGLPKRFVLVLAIWGLVWAGDAWAANGLASATADAAYQKAVASSSGLDYSTALAYLNESLAANPDNGAAYLARAWIDLVLDVPSQAVSDASQAVGLLRASDVCDQYLPEDSPILAAAGYNSSDSFPLGSSLGGYGSILNGSSLYSTTNIIGGSTSGTTTGTASGSATGSTTGTSTGTSTGTTTGTSSNGAVSSSTTTSSSTTASGSLFSSSKGSQKLPVSEDLTEKDKEENETRNEYNVTMTEVAMASAYCGGTYLKNMEQLLTGYTLLGDAYLAQESYADAQLAYKAALALDDDNAKATGGLGLAYLGQRASTAALSTLNLAVTYDPTLPNVYVDRGAYWVSIDDASRALEDYNTALSLDAGYARAYDAIGQLAYDAGKYKDAVAHYDKALAAQPYYVAALKHRAKAWAALAAVYPDQAAVYEKKAEDDLARASSLQELVGSSSTTASGSVP